MKICRVCSRSPEETAFAVHKSFADGLDTICKECKNKRQRERYVTGNARANHLKRYDGMTPERYKEMFDEQGGVCAICGQASANALDVDHCHDKKNVRGLLCRNCNLGLGYFRDNRVSLLAAIDYLTPS